MVPWDNFRLTRGRSRWQKLVIYILPVGSPRSEILGPPYPWDGYSLLFFTQYLKGKSLLTKVRQMWVVTLRGDLIGDVLHKVQVRSTRNQHACMIRCMNVDEARGVCKDRSRWRSVVFAYPHGKKAWVYVCMYLEGEMGDWIVFETS